MNDIKEILPKKLYQSGELTKSEWEFIEQRKIAVVINVRHREEGWNFTPEYPHIYMHVPLNDKSKLPDMRILDVVANFGVNSIERGFPTLVHCLAGLNRSMLVIGCMLHRFGMSGPDIVTTLREIRPGSLTNQTFLQYLMSLP